MLPLFLKTIFQFLKIICESLESTKNCEIFLKTTNYINISTTVLIWIQQDIFASQTKIGRGTYAL